MNLISSNDLELLNDNIKKIVDDIHYRVEKRKEQEITQHIDIASQPEDNESSEKEPTTEDVNNVPTESETKTETTDKEIPKLYLEDVKDIIGIILKFVSDNKLKVYGGYAHNKVISNKKPSDAFYSEQDVPDIDVMSPSPIQHMVQICDILEEKGFPGVVGKEAIHEGTYRVYVRDYNALDLSYVPTNIFNSVPFIKIDNINYIHPQFAMLDLLKMITEPNYSSWRWEKTVPRLYLLQHHFPIYKSKKSLEQIITHKKNVDKELNIIFNYLKNKDDVMLLGDYVYNKYVDLTKIKKHNNLIEPVDITHYEFIATKYTKTVLEILDLLKKQNKNVKIVEYYPYFNLTDFSIKIYCDNELVAVIYGNNSRCVPVKKLEIDKKNYVTVGCFDFVYLSLLINSFRMKTINDIQKKMYYTIQSQNIVEMRNYYFEKNNKNLLDNTLFQSFLDETTCIGPAVDTLQEAKDKRKQRKQEGKRPLFIYKPVKELTTVWTFKNSSGNAINNQKNKKITNLIKKQK